MSEGSVLLEEQIISYVYKRSFYTNLSCLLVMLLLNLTFSHNNKMEGHYVAVTTICMIVYILH